MKILPANYLCNHFRVVAQCSCLPGADPISGLWPELGKRLENVGFYLPQKKGKIAEELEKWPKNVSTVVWGAIFSNFSAVFPVFWRQNLTFLLFQAVGTKWSLYQANRIASVAEQATL